MIGCLPSCENKPSAPLAQSVEHLPFKQGVRGSNPRRGTKEKHRSAVLLFGIWWIRNELRLRTAQRGAEVGRSSPGDCCISESRIPSANQPLDGVVGGTMLYRICVQGFPLTRPFPCPHREAIPSNTTKLGIPHGASLFGIWWIRNELRLRATQRDVEAGRNIPPAHRGSIPQFFCWKNRRTCGIIS